MNLMRLKNSARQAVVVLAAAAMITTITPSTARAQIFGGIVFDPTEYSLQVEKRIEEAARWIQTIDHYARIYENAVRQLTTLTGVLKTAEAHLGFHKQTLSTISAIGASIRTSFRIKRLAEGLVVGRVRALKEIDERLRNGIFDPETDRVAFEDYLKNGIGRTSADALASMERLRKMDNTIARAEYDIQRLSNSRAEAETHIKEMQDKLKELQVSEDSTQKDRDIAALQVQIFQAGQEQSRRDEDIAKLRKEITDRTERIAAREEARLRNGTSITTLRTGWKKLADESRQSWDKILTGE
jgi:uncharacterized protein (DUF3084 family)